MDVRWNSTYLMLKHLLPYKKMFSTFIGANYGLVNGEPLLSEGHWVVAQKILEFLNCFMNQLLLHQVFIILPVI
jgi:hypothetical protein